MGLCTRADTVIEPGVRPEAKGSRPSSREKPAKGGKGGKGKAEAGVDGEREKLNSAPTSAGSGDLGDRPPRDVHSAPAPLKKTEHSSEGAREYESIGPMERLNVHVEKGLPSSRPAPASPEGQRVGGPRQCVVSGAGEFTIEGADGAVAADVDAYITTVLGSNAVAMGLRSTQWADRVHALEAFDAQLEAFECRSERATETEARQLFNVAVTILARSLHDKLVPVYLPALALLVRIYSPTLLDKVDKATSKAAIAYLAPPVVTRAGSSNVRAREESANAMTHLAACKHPGTGVACPHALKPLKNMKAAHAAIGRLDLLHALVLKVGFSHVGFKVTDVLAFAVPFCDNASDKVRTASQHVLREALLANPGATIEFVSKQKPEIVASLRKRATEFQSGAREEEGLAVEGTAVGSKPAAGTRLASVKPSSREGAALLGDTPVEIFGEKEKIGKSSSSPSRKGRSGFGMRGPARKVAAGDEPCAPVRSRSAVSRVGEEGAGAAAKGDSPTGPSRHADNQNAMKDFMSDFMASETSANGPFSTGASSSKRQLFEVHEDEDDIDTILADAEMALRS